MCSACGKILPHVTGPTRSTHDSHTFCERCTRLGNVLARHDTFSHTRPPTNFWTRTKLFQLISVWVACELTRLARPKYIPGALVTRRTSFTGVLHTLLSRWACRWPPNAGECNHIHYKVWSEINYPFSNRPKVTFSLRFHSAWTRTDIRDYHYNIQILDMKWFPHWNTVQLHFHVK